jgi:hypothetical protein
MSPIFSKPISYDAARKQLYEVCEKIWPAALKVTVRTGKAKAKSSEDVKDGSDTAKFHCPLNPHVASSEKKDTFERRVSIMKEGKTVEEYCSYRNELTEVAALVTASDSEETTSRKRIMMAIATLEGHLKEHFEKMIHDCQSINKKIEKANENKNENAPLLDCDEMLVRAFNKVA